MLFFLLLSALLLALVPAAIQSEGRVCTTDKQWSEHPLLCQSLQRIVENDTDRMAQEITATARQSGWLLDFRSSLPVTSRRRRLQSKKGLPIVLAHGMGDSCFNPGIQHILATISKEWMHDVYTVCIPTGKTQAEDTNNGFFLVGALVVVVSP